MVRWARAPNSPDAGDPRCHRPARPGRHHGRDPELQECGHHRLRGAGRAGRPRPVLPRPPPGRRQLGCRVARRHGSGRRRDRAARLRRADPARPAEPQARAGEPDVSGDRRRRRQGRGAADHLRDRRGARGRRRWSSSTATSARSCPSGSSSWPARSSRAGTTSSRRSTRATSTTARSPTPSPTR